MASIRLNNTQQQCLLLSVALMMIVLCSLLIDSASAAGGSGTGGGGGGGGRGSGGSYNYGSYGSLGPAAGVAGAGGPSMGSGGLGMRRGIYGPVGLGNPHDPQRYGAGGSSAAQQSPASGKPGGHHRLSAWGIITIVTFVILIGAGAYWGFICYPFFCKKERNYNMMMNMSSATTATPSTRSTEFEKLDHCCSKSTTSTRSNDTGISNI
ncbi:hypothetical protein AND_006416 [Anopheles darlingi]|uniref:Uncharacterized protein n=1 Tax=Anopheles darlingi TaxID=43151 RepID=W5JC74_ANODA|nr:hypothetical protein AND_006416 [Anopheles darlingi]